MNTLTHDFPLGQDEAEILLDPETDEIVDSPFWRRERSWSFDQNMERNAILMGWRTGSIDSVVALNALIEFEVLDYDKTMELLSGYFMTLEKVEG